MQLIQPNNKAKQGLNRRGLFFPIRILENATKHMMFVYYAQNIAISQKLSPKFKFMIYSEGLKPLAFTMTNINNKISR